MYAIPLAYVALTKDAKTTDLDRWLRWEYQPADRTRVILSARGGFVLFPPRTRSEPKRRFRARIRAAIGVLRRVRIAESVDG
jgi:hypothetical protein